MESSLYVKHGQWATYRWVDSSNGPVGTTNVYGAAITSTWTTSEGGNSLAKAFVTPVTDMTVKVRIQGLSDAGAIYASEGNAGAGGSYVVIREVR